MTLSFGFSLLTYLFIEAPCANVLNDFYRKEKPAVHAHYVSQSAKAPLRKPQRGMDEESGQQRPRRKRKVKKSATLEDEVSGGASINQEELLEAERIDD